MRRFILLVIAVFFPLMGCSTINSVIFYFPRKVSNAVSNITKPSRVEQAFAGKFSPPEANKAIHAYCQTCHIHRNIPTNQCLDTKPALYSRKPYKTATECRVCHYLDKDFLSTQFHRVTRFPAEVSQDKYKDFEKEYLTTVIGSDKDKPIKGNLSKK